MRSTRSSRPCPARRAVNERARTGAFRAVGNLETFATYSATYAGLVGIMTALIFLYLMGVVLIFGAEFNAALAKSQSMDTAA